MTDKLNRRNFLRRLSGAPLIAPAAVGLTTTGLLAPKAKAMSPANYDFWTHGSCVQIENPELVEGPGRYLKRYAFGAHVRQGPNTANWFHFAIPTTTVHEDHKPSHEEVYLRVWMSQGVMIDAIDIYDGEGMLHHYGGPPIVGWDAMEFIPIGIPAGPMFWGLGISVHVNWLPGGGEIRFIGAGARFDIP